MGGFYLWHFETVQLHLLCIQLFFSCDFFFVGFKWNHQSTTNIQLSDMPRASVALCVSHSARKTRKRYELSNNDLSLSRAVVTPDHTSAAIRVSAWVVWRVFVLAEYGAKPGDFSASTHLFSHQFSPDLIQIVKPSL